jgi:hypothetical protein
MSTATIRIRNGSYRNKSVSGMCFELVEQYKKTATGGHVTVRNNGTFPDFPDTIRIKLDGVADYEFVTGDAVITSQIEEKAQVSVETDEQVIERIRERFDILHEMTKAATNGEIRAMIVSGPPGVGKSFGVEQEIEKATLLDQIAGKKLRAEVVKGSATPIGLYQTLYK